MWTKQSLHTLIEQRLGDIPLIVVANREPYIHRWKGDKIECAFPASGMVSALDPILRACGGTWIAHGSGSADRKTSDAQGRLRVPPDDPQYTLRRVWLTKAQEDGFYYGMANEGLWPLCHVAYVRPVYNPEDWEMYREVNALFAEAILDEAQGKPCFVFIQDYHFALLPKMIKEANPNIIVAQFWHIPWPNSEQVRTFPWNEEMLEGLLGNDLLGFHLRYHCQNFLETVDRLLEARVDAEQSDVHRSGKTTRVRPFAISIDYDKHAATAESEPIQAMMQEFHHELGLEGMRLGIGIERIDYTKGIPERLRGLDRLLEKYPEHREKILFVQAGVPSRTHVPAYKRLDDEIDDLVDEINWKWSTEAWKPILYLKKQQGLAEMISLHRLADFCIVSSLHDGLNLVAKEFAASRVDEDGVLILSQFTGSSREMPDALIINPFSVDDVAEAMHKALIMPEEERHKRMRKLRQAVSENNVYRWAGKIIHALLAIDFPEPEEAHA
jgi:alpha,alpha-trehalose-phosphate synthase [UDP-forming]